MEEYKSNSNKCKEDVLKNPSTAEKKVQKVVSGSVKTKKKSEVKKLADVFISDDISKVKQFVVFDVLIPSLKKAISDIITNGIDMILYGESGRNKNYSTPASKVSYRNYNDISRSTKPTPRYNSQRSVYDYDDVIVETRGEAEAVIMQMDEIISTYDMVKVADLYDLVGITGNYTDNNYGWTDIRSAQIIRVREGYLLKFPKVIPLD